MRRALCWVALLLANSFHLRSNEISSSRAAELIALKSACLSQPLVTCDYAREPDKSHHRTRNQKKGVRASITSLPDQHLIGSWLAHAQSRSGCTRSMIIQPKTDCHLTKELLSPLIGSSSSSWKLQKFLLQVSKKGDELRPFPLNKQAHMPHPSDWLPNPLPIYNTTFIGHSTTKMCIEKATVIFAACNKTIPHPRVPKTVMCNKRFRSPELDGRGQRSP